MYFIAFIHTHQVYVFQDVSCTYSPTNSPTFFLDKTQLAE